MYLFRVLLYCHVWHIFQHYLMNGNIFGKKVFFKIKFGLFLSLQLWSGIFFFVLRRILLLIIVDIHSSKCEVTVVLVKCLSDLNFLDRFSKNPQISNFVKNLQWEQRCSSRTDRHMTKLIAAIRDFSNELNKHKVHFPLE